MMYNLLIKTSNQLEKSNNAISTNANRITNTWKNTEQEIKYWKQDKSISTIISLIDLNRTLAILK